MAVNAKIYVWPSSPAGISHRAISNGRITDYLEMTDPLQSQVSWDLINTGIPFDVFSVEVRQWKVIYFCRIL